MEWILWFALKGTEGAQPIAVHDKKETCEYSKKLLTNQIDTAIFDCWEQPKGTYKEKYSQE